MQHALHHDSFLTLNNRFRLTRVTLLPLAILIVAVTVGLLLVAGEGLIVQSLI